MTGKIPEITHFTFGWIAQSDCFIGGGFTRNEAIDDWVDDVTERGSPGAFYTRHALKIAKELKREA